MRREAREREIRVRTAESRMSEYREVNCRCVRYKLYKALVLNEREKAASLSRPTRSRLHAKIVLRLVERRARRWEGGRIVHGQGAAGGLPRVGEFLEGSLG
jgi:hypothetical protein